jgi:hypothetical protein
MKDLLFRLEYNISYNAVRFAPGLNSEIWFIRPLIAIKLL